MKKRSGRMTGKLLLVLVLMGLGFLGVRALARGYEVEPTMAARKDISQPGNMDMCLSGVRQAALVFEGETLAASEASPRPTASTAKMILALAVMEAKPFDLGENGEEFVATVKDEERWKDEVWRDGSSTRVRNGDKISEREALEALMIMSSNNIADSLAEWVFGGQTEYKAAAEKLLERIGANDTAIGADASGFDPGTHATAEDLAKIGWEVIQDDVLAEIVAKQTASWGVSGDLTNTNTLLAQYEQAAGIKTGRTNEAGNVLVAAMEGELGKFVAVVMGAESRAAAADATWRIMKCGEENIREEVVLVKGEDAGYFAPEWAEAKVPIKTAEDITEVVWPGRQLEITFEAGPQKVIRHGKVGVARLGDKTVNLVVEEDLDGAGIEYRLKNLLKW